MHEVTLRNGEKMLIRKIVPDDAEAMLAYLRQVGSESDNLLFGAEGVPYTLEQERDMLAKIADAKTSTMLCGVVGGTIIAVVNINAPTRERIAHTSEIGVSVLKRYWHQGVATHMITALIDFAKATGVIKVVHLAVRSDNVRAIGVYERLGFVPIGRYGKQLCIRGEFVDTILMNLYL